MIELARRHSFHLPSYAAHLRHITSPKQAISEASGSDLTQLLILGEGTNTAFVDDVDLHIWHVDIKGIEHSDYADHSKLKVGAGENWHQLVNWCLENGIHGMENLALIPGSVGASPVQNIGAYGVEVARFVESVDCVDLQTGQYITKHNQECQFGYRDSLFKREWKGKLLICSVNFVIPKRWQPELSYGELSTLNNPTPRDVYNKVIAIRTNKLPDPDLTGNAGSFFKNPVIPVSLFDALQSKWTGIPHYKADAETVKVPAAWLIDKLGFKGKKIGGIACHPNQPLVLTNDGTGTGEQLIELARLIRDTVYKEFDIELENEVQLIGKMGPIRL